MQRDQFTVNFHQSPTFERLAAGSIQEKDVYVEVSAISFTGKEPSPDLERDLEMSMRKWLKQRGRDERSMSRSPTPEPTRRRG